MREGEGENSKLYLPITLSKFSTFDLTGSSKATIPVSLGKNVKSATVSVVGSLTTYDLIGRTSIDLPAGQDVIVKAEAEKGYSIGISPSGTVNVDVLQEIRVNTYGQSSGGSSGGGTSYFYLSLNAGEGASAAPTCNKNITKGYTTTISFTITAAAPTEGYDFDGWYNTSTGKKESSDRVYTFTISSSKTLEARYVKEEVPPVDEAVKYFLEEVESIPATPTWKDRELVDAIQADYEKLNNEQKKQSDVAAAKEKLDKAIEEVAASEKAEAEAAERAAADQAAADKAVEAVNKIPENVSLDDKVTVEAARTAYDGLTEDQKVLVPKGILEKLADAEAKIEELEEKQKELEEQAKADAAVAERFTKAVNSVPGAKAGTEKGLLDEATKIRKGMTDAQLALVKKKTLLLYDEEVAAFTRNRIFKSGTAYYKVLSNGDVTYLKPASRDIENVTVPNQVKKGKFYFKVIKVSNNAFRSCKNLKEAVIGKYVRVLGQNIFARDYKLTEVTVLGKGFKSGKVTDAFVKAGKDGKLTVKVPGSKVKAYRKLFTGEGGLNGKVKAA